MLFELRQYRIKDGRRAEWVRLFEEKIVPFQTAQGAVATGSFTAEEEDDLFIWIRRFESEEERKRIYDRIYESEEWKTDIKPEIDRLLDRERIHVTRMRPTGRSVMH